MADAEELDFSVESFSFENSLFQEFNVNGNDNDSENDNDNDNDIKRKNNNVTMVMHSASG